MKVALIPIVIDVFGMVTKGFVEGVENLEIRGHVETIQTTALLRSDLLSIRFQWKKFGWRWFEKLSNEQQWNVRVKIILIVVGVLGNVSQEPGEGTGESGNQWENQNYSVYKIV